MNFKKIVSAVAAAAVAVSTLAVSAFAFEMNSEYTGGWSASKTIPKSEFEAIGGDVKVVLTVERKDPLVGEGNYLLKPMNICVSWDAITDQLTSDTAIRKGDGFIVVGKDVTSVEFVVPESTWSSFVDYEGGDGPDAGLAFQVNDVIIKSADLSAGAPEGDFTVVSEEESAEIMKNGVPAAAAPAAEEAPAAEAAPAADTATTSTATGNASAAVIVSVMALAGAAVIASKKRK
ncbi:MAG: hypothetical protein ACI4JF_06215 [Oscillospiraceae bacterium]